MDNISAKLGKNLKKIRTEKGISQGDISRKLNMDRGYISGIENGRRNPTIETLEKIASAIGVGVDDLIK
jgi:transcriptional regulator with XRE-family HTH domain